MFLLAGGLINSPPPKKKTLGAVIAAWQRARACRRRSHRLALLGALAKTDVSMEFRIEVHNALSL